VYQEICEALVEDDNPIRRAECVGFYPASDTPNEFAAFPSLGQAE
jgi:hypothetical protein